MSKRKSEVGLRLAIKRLEGSVGKGRTARRNARNALRRALSHMKAELLAEFPVIGKDGVEVRYNKPKGCKCPACNAPMASVRSFCEHWAKKHIPAFVGGVGSWQFKCGCGKVFDRKHLKRFVRHVAGLDDIAVHFTMGMLANFDRGPSANGQGG